MHDSTYSYQFSLQYYPFSVNLHRCYNTLNELSKWVRVPNKVEALNLNVFNMITKINESKTLAKHIYANVNLSLMVESIIQIRSGITVNVVVSVKIWKNILCEKDYI